MVSHDEVPLGVAVHGSNRSRHLRVVLAQPRGFCAGVVRAIDIVERALERYGSPVYVRHEIVHNRHVVEKLKAKGLAESSAAAAAKTEEDEDMVPGLPDEPAAKPPEESIELPPRPGDE